MRATIVLMCLATLAIAETAGETDLKLFDDAAKWEFVKNTGDGSTDAIKDGEKPVLVINFDFSKSKTKNVPYVLAMGETDIPEGGSTLELSGRADHAQRVTIRLVDSTGQTLQWKGSLKGTKDWEKLSIPLTKKLEHWGGDNDGKIHYPIKKLGLGIPLTGEAKTGKVEFADAKLVK